MTLPTTVLHEGWGTLPPGFFRYVSSTPDDGPRIYAWLRGRPLRGWPYPTAADHPHRPLAFAGRAIVLWDFDRYFAATELGRPPAGRR